MKISLAIMAHPSRRTEALNLARKISKMPFTHWRVLYDTGGGEWETGERALREYDKEADWHVVLQDDAVIGDNFYENLVSALNSAPETTLISLYLGKVRPLRGAIKIAFNQAIANNKSWIQYITLLWGVGIVIPTWQIENVLAHAEGSTELYDRRIGEYYKYHHLPVLYTTTSLVNHDDSLPSLTGHGGTKEPRVAHMYSNDLIEFNDRIQRI